MNKSEFVKQARDRYKEAREFWHNWRAEAKDDYSFIAGRQWLPEDEAILTEQKRPPITFNYSEKMVDAVIGAEVSNRQEVRYGPREMSDAPQAELRTNAAKWVRDLCDAEDEESDAFRDAMICGMGWTRTRLTHEEDLDGTIVVERIDPLEMLPDPAAIKIGLRDRRYHFRHYWADKKDVKKEWPSAPLSEEAVEVDATGGVVRHGQSYNDEDDDETERRRRKDQVQLRHYETFEREDVYRVAHPSGSIATLTEKEFKPIKQAVLAAGLQFVKQRRRVYYQAWFIGETLLEIEKSSSQEGFTYNCITGKRDRNKNTWYGLTRVMKDPQRWANKWLSQILHIINTNAKGGLLAEIGAFVDPKMAQEDWSSPDSVTLLNEGGISKVKEKQMGQYPSGLDKLMEFALGSLPMVTGINLEALGLANREQAGVLESQRKQAAFGLLAPLFSSLRLYRKVQGRVLMYMMDEYISDGRLVRIGGPESEQFLPLLKAEGSRRYDIIVDQSPNAPDVKQKTWEALVQILPAMMKAGIPVAPDVLDFTPLPTTLTMKWKQFIGQQEQVNQEAQQQIAQLEEENQKLKAQEQIKAAELQMKQQEKEMELAMKERELQMEMQMREREMQMKEREMMFEMGLKRQQAELEFDLERFRMSNQMDIDRSRAEHERTMQEQKTQAEVAAIKEKAKAKPAKKTATTE